MSTRETVIRHRTGGRDKVGDPLPAEPDVEMRARVGPRSSTEDANATNMVIDSLVLQLQAGADVRPSDQFTVRGKRYGVEGEPFDAGRKGVLTYLTGAIEGG